MSKTKKELMEGALYPLIINAKARESWWRRGIARGFARFFAFALAKQAIIIEVLIANKARGRIGKGDERKWSEVRFFIEHERGPLVQDHAFVDGWPIPFGKALAIIVPSEND